MLNLYSFSGLVPQSNMKGATLCSGQCMVVDDLREMVVCNEYMNSKQYIDVLEMVLHASFMKIGENSKSCLKFATSMQWLLEQSRGICLSGQHSHQIKAPIEHF